MVLYNIYIYMYIDPDFHTILCFSFCFLRGNKSTVVSKVCVWVVPFRVINSLSLSLSYENDDACCCFCAFRANRPVMNSLVSNHLLTVDLMQATCVPESVSDGLEVTHCV